MTDDQLAAMHRLLANYHRKLATEALLDVVQQYHADLAQRLADEAGLIPRRTAIVERLYEREQTKNARWRLSTDDGSPLSSPNRNRTLLATTRRRRSRLPDFRPIAINLNR